MDTRHPIPEQFRRARQNESEALRQRQLAAVWELMGLPIPRNLRLELRAFEASLTPAIIDHERTVA